MNTNTLLAKAKEGFNTLDVSQKYVDAALKWLEVWLSDQMFSEYVHQIQYLIQNERWNFLLDAFYQVIPFGTGGRRGLVGIGPNRLSELLDRPLKLIYLLCADCRFSAHPAENDRCLESSSGNR